jgi:class 3 adenylate cyclase
MRDFPRGTVTFLLTDIEGSTRLLHEHGERYAELLGEHRRVLREAFARHGGVEVDTQGDAFFVAFARASDAIAAASDGQAALRDGAISVRMGLHTGEPVVTDEGYVGIDVHRAARASYAQEPACSAGVSFVLRRYSQRMTLLRPREDALRPVPAVAPRPPFVHIPA